MGLSPPSAPAYLLAVDRNAQQWVQGNQERHEVEGDTHIKCVVHDSADDKRHEAYLKTKQESYSADTKGYTPHWSSELHGCAFSVPC